MADQHPIEGSSMSDVSGESSESTVELNIKTLDSKIYNFHVDKNMSVSLFKEKIASEIGVPVGQQRLIFRGKVLKDDHLLSDYHVENGHTLHLVERQPSQLSPSSSTSTAETTANNSNRAQEPNAGGSRNRVGQISHSVVLGTFNVGDQGEGIVPDLNRVIGAVLNSIGIGNQIANGAGVTLPGMQFNAPVQPLPANETEGTQGNAGIQSQTGNQSQPGQPFAGQSLPHVLQIPVGAAVPIPSLNMPIPDSLNTLSEFMNRMEQALSQNGYQPDQRPTNLGDQLTTELPSDARGLSTPEALSIVLRRAQRLLSGQAVSALSHIAGRLEQEEGSSDSATRGQIQAESVQVGLAMQHLGALFLELGRTILTLRMGQSPAESSVNAGPAVYISPSGPNPIMVQPFPPQTSSLFSGRPATPTNIGAFGPVGTGNAPRHVNIHIHTGASLTPIVSTVGQRTAAGEAMQGEHVNGTSSGDSGQTRVFPARNVIAAAVPSQPIVVSASGPGQHGVNVAQPSADPVQLSTVLAEVNSRIRSFVENARSENLLSTGQPGSSTVQNQPVGSGGGETSQSVPSCMPQMVDQKQQSGETEEKGVTDSLDGPSSSSVSICNSSGEETTLKSVVDTEDAPRSGQGTNNPDGASAVPLGLGLGGLQPKGWIEQQRSQGKNSDVGASNVVSANLVQDAQADGQKVLQCLASMNSTNTLASGQLPHAGGELMENIQSAEQHTNGQFNVASAMSQVLHSPVLDGLLAGVSRQTGVGSPDVLRNMLQQLTQSPVMRNTVDQIAQQIDSQDLGSLFAGLDGGQGGGIDLSRMVQQMMPIVSQALGGGSSVHQPVRAVEAELQPPCSESRPSRDDQPNHQNSQIDLQQVAHSIEHQSPAGEVFRSMVESAAQSCDNGNFVEGLVDGLGTEEGLACEFMEILHRDISRRLQDATRSSEKP